MKLYLGVDCNDLGGMLINKNIPRTAGASHGQEVLPEDLEGIIREIERIPHRRTTLYEMPECEYSQSR